MLKRLKDWLIKRLGGYTKEEYNDWSRIPIVKPLIREERFRAVDLRAERTVYFEDVMALGEQQTEIRTRREIVEELSHAMLPYIVWRKTQNPGVYKMRVEGLLLVQERV